jgi:hypothetical protein
MFLELCLKLSLNNVRRHGIRPPSRVVLCPPRIRLARVAYVPAQQHRSCLNARSVKVVELDREERCTVVSRAVLTKRTSQAFGVVCWGCGTHDHANTTNTTKATTNATTSTSCSSASRHVSLVRVHHAGVCGVRCSCACNSRRARGCGCSHILRSAACAKCETKSDTAKVSDCVHGEWKMYFWYHGL